MGAESSKRAARDPFQRVFRNPLRGFWKPSKIPSREHQRALRPPKKMRSRPTNPTGQKAPQIGRKSVKGFLHSRLAGLEAFGLEPSAMRGGRPRAEELFLASRRARQRLSSSWCLIETINKNTFQEWFACCGKCSHTLRHHFCTHLGPTNCPIVQKSFFLGFRD